MDVIFTVNIFVGKYSFYVRYCIICFVHYRSYADIGIHEQMIADDIRTQAYRLFFLYIELFYFLHCTYAAVLV